MSAGTLALLCRGLAGALAPLRMALDPEQVDGLFADLGLGLPPQVRDDPVWRTSVSKARDTAGELPGLVEQLTAAIVTDDNAAIVAHTAALAGRITMLRDRLTAVGDRLATLAPAFPSMPASEVAAFAAELPRRMLELMVVNHLERTTRGLLNGLALSGLIERRREQGVPNDPARPTHVVRRLRLDRLGPLLRSPGKYLSTIYGWSDPAFDGHALLAQLGEAGRLASLPVVLVDGPSGPLLDLLGGTVTADASTSPPGLRGGLRIALPAAQTFDLPLKQSGWRVRLASGPELPAGLSVQLVPPGRVVVTPPPGAPHVAGAVSAEATITAVPPQTHVVLLGQAGKSRLEVASVTAAARAELVWDAASGSAQAEPVLELAVHGGRFVLNLEGAGALLSALIPKDLVQADLDLAIRWSQGRIYLRGGAGLRAAFPVHLSLGPVDLQTVTVALDPSGESGLPVELSVNLRTMLGPLALLIEGVGITANLAFPPGGGNVGPLDVSFGFRAPGGIGLSLDAGPVTGAGYLAFDPPANRYAGALRLRLALFDAAAYAVYKQVTGRTSVVAVLGARFTPGIQLGFGFALTGLGGLIGLNRRAQIDLLRERLASGAAGNVLFCEDPVRNAPALLGDLEAFFPSADGGFLVGPTVQISWLSPIVRIDLGLIIELPGPSRVMILGSIRALIGISERAALLYLRMDVLGVVDLAGRRISLDAVLVGSHALGVFRLAGGMAFRLDYGSNPYVLFSVGGFHPRFDPGPLDLPRLDRVGASLDVNVVAHAYLRLEMYLAFTANTLQAGARVEAGVELGPLSAHGHFVFDALLQFRPFHFEATFSAGFSVEALGLSFASVAITGRISGPGPLVVYAKGRVKRLGVSVSGSATFELGSHDAERVQPISSPVQHLADELKRASNLRVGGEDPSVLLRPDRAVVPGVLVTPKGSLVWEQKRAPLNTLIRRLGGVPLDGAHQLRIEVPAEWQVSEERDWFNPGAFTDLDLRDSQTLNNAAFAELPSGVRLGGAADAVAPTAVSYTERIDLVKRPTRLRLTDLLAKAYLTKALHAALNDRTMTPTIDPGSAKVTVAPETADVYAPDGTLKQAHETPFQAFQLVQSGAGSAFPSADVAVAL
ncbi:MULTISPECIES: DUF6603 domain-containing protein [Streptomyces]|uniref:DUF6603 domain-containing protein n=1 Tax=Streptomyces chartreusis NRRL 3882 TaxID=1079985 RepID=A0A2N9AZW1_STRCX|nr:MULTISPECIES: DUF6603 domain-containing protein [Streptomyces]MYS95590.1 hypothetical protein [Streptomyces sp. SID5464]SOR76608.1 hypothetical protein SCNRRL3882_0091 [Streptomyces chartreusis NRRL 3882]